MKVLWFVTTITQRAIPPHTQSTHCAWTPMSAEGAPFPALHLSWLSNEMWGKSSTKILLRAPVSLEAALVTQVGCDCMMIVPLRAESWRSVKMCDTKLNHCYECKQMWTDRDVMTGRGKEGDRNGGGGVLAAGNISLQRLSVGFLSSTNQHSKATQ